MNDGIKRNKKKPVSVDGFRVDRSRFGSSNDINFKMSKKGRNTERPSKIGNFDSAEGLTPVGKNDVITTPKRPKYDERSNKLKFWKRKKADKFDGIDYYEAKKAKRKKRLKIAGIVILVFLAIFGFLVAKGYINLRKILQGGGGAAALEENVDPSKLRGEGDGRVNILLLGRGGPGHDGPDLTDTIILASIDPINNEAALISLPRDLYVTVPGYGSMKINSVFASGKAASLSKAGKVNSSTKEQAEKDGLTLLEQEVTDVLGIPIHYHAIVDFQGFKEAIDTVGGIDVNVTEPVYEQMWIVGSGPYTLNEKVGVKHMDGFEALAYSRSRHTSKRGDFSRAERQRAMISATKDKVFSLGTFSNPGKVSGLLNNLGNHVKTNFSLDDLMRLYEITQKIDNSKIESIGLVDPPHDLLTTSSIGGLSVVIPKAGQGNYDAIHSYIRNEVKDGFLKQEDAKVMVLNGTNRTGLANDKAEELKSYGYNVIKVDSAPSKSYSNTVLVDLRNNEKKYTRRYLEQRFHVLGTGSLPDQSIQPGEADFVIILGSDIAAQ